MNLKVDITGFSIDERRYNVGDVLCYSEKKKGIILFGFYYNGWTYECDERGCGFYTMTCDLVNGHWKIDEDSHESIYVDFDVNKETDPKIINEVRELFGSKLQE